MARVDRAGSIGSGSPVLWYGVTHARSVADSVDQVGRVAPTRALSLDVPVEQHMAELIIYTPTGRRRRLPERGTVDRAA